MGDGVVFYMYRIDPASWALLAFAMYAFGRFVLHYALDRRQVLWRRVRRMIRRP